MPVVVIAATQGVVCLLKLGRAVGILGTFAKIDPVTAMGDVTAGIADSPMMLKPCEPGMPPSTFRMSVVTFNWLPSIAYEM